MKKIILTIILFTSLTVMSNCDSLSFKKDINNLFEYGLKNIPREIVKNDKLYNENFQTLLSKTRLLESKYKICDNKFYDNGIKYIYRYFIFSFCVKGSFYKKYETFDHKNTIALTPDFVMNCSDKWLIDIDSLKGLNSLLGQTMYEGNNIHLFVNDSLLKVYYSYFYNNMNISTSIPNDLSYFSVQHYLNDVYSTKLNDKAKKYLLIISITATLFFIMIFITFIQLRKNKKQKLKINELYNFISHKNQEITDSINYSKRIQSAILPDLSEIKSNLTDVFVFYKPKDIVSGDFYYFNKISNDSFIAVADCTGHGVPGAFMSLIGSKELKIANSQSTSPSSILNILNKGVKETLKQNQLDGTKDGMDIALLKINKSQVFYSGANRPLWLIENNTAEIREIKATKTAIAGYTDDNQIFEEHELNLKSGDILYVFSDGYADQFGGEKQKKMTTKRFKDLLLSIKNKTMSEQLIEVELYIKKWQGDIEQVDDVLVIGIKI